MNDFHHPEQSLSAFRRRVIVAMIFTLLCFGLLVARFYYLQVVRYDYFHARAEGNRIALLPVVPNRGVIMDRNGKLLARNYSVYTLEINPTRVRNLNALIDDLATIVTIDERDRRRFFKQVQESKYFDSVPIRTHLTDEEVARLVARRYRFPGVEVQARLFRDYPYGASTAHVVGYIGRINDRDLEKIEEWEATSNYRGSEYIGKSGLELSYESQLHGITGVEKVEINASGRAMRSMSRTPARPGNDIKLSLDIDLQQAIEAAFGNRRGAVVAIDPSTGGILALVSTPSFDPNLFIEGISVADWRALSDSPDHPLLNRAVYSAYPPGSTFKPFVALAGLESGKRNLSQRFDHQGIYTFANQRFVDRKSNCQNNVDLHRSLVYSCNTYYYLLANELGINALAEFVGQFGFGSRTGIDIPGETTGVLPTPEWKRSRFTRREQQSWFGGETLSIGIGQGYNAYTPLQLAHALAGLVNDGKLIQPHLVKEIINPATGDSLPVPLQTTQLKIKPEHLQAVRAAMHDVTRVGTAARAFAGAPYTAGAKTGTAQVFSLRGQKYEEGKVAERLRDHSWFIGFAPAEKPEIVIAVLVENGGFGSQSAAPLARQVFDFYLLNKQADAPASEEDEALAAELEQ